MKEMSRPAFAHFAQPGMVYSCPLGGKQASSMCRHGIKYVYVNGDNKFFTNAYTP